jgi:hypothetical protein
MSLKDCPEEYYVNCTNAGLHCRRCAAGYKGIKLLYNPLHDIGEHPWQPNLKGKKIQARAQKTERQVKEGIATATLRSGAACHDGDLKLVGDLRVEVKDRGERASFNLTLTEFNKGVRQQIDVYAISIIRPDNKKRETIYMLSENLFGALVNLIKQDLTKQEEKI